MKNRQNHSGRESTRTHSPAYANYMHMQHLQQQLATEQQEISRSLFDIYQGQIIRLAKIWLSRPIGKENVNFHFRVGEIQCKVILAQIKLKNKTLTHQVQ